MRVILSLAFLLNVYGFAAYAQPPAQPAPLIYRSPEKTDLKEFVSEDKTFQITFPGVPEITEQKTDNAFITNYRVYRQGSNSIVTVTDFDFDVEGIKEKVYELGRSALLKTPESKIKAERDVRTNGKSGKEFDVLHNNQYQKVRIIAVGKRVYEIKSDATNWQISGEAVKKQFFDETERFFNSLKINGAPKNKLNVAPKKNAVSQIPNDFLGAADANGYKNTFFGFTFNFPDNWYPLTETQIQTSKDFGKAILKTENERVNRAFEESEKKEVAIFAMIRKNLDGKTNANLAITAIKQPNSQISAETVAAATQKFLLTNPKIKLLRDVREIEINRTAFSSFAVRTDIGGKIIDQKIYIVMRKGYSLTFALTYQDSENSAAIEKIMQSLKFDAK